MKSILQRLFFVLAATAIVICVYSCKNDEDPIVTTANITITTPAEGAMIEQGAPVHVTGTITTEGELHGYEIYIRKKSDNSAVFTFDEHAHGKTLSFDEQWVNNVTTHTDMELEVIAILSHEGDVTVSKKLNFHCHP
ncbi:MAG: hypothetical protein HUU34_21445 [Saprospiraceae bacterium]|jgi:hypothetical protein|nr:hypothetical protein [Saprospiraceae bacterium]